MTRERVEVLYYVRTKFGTMKRFREVMSESDYLDLCLDEDVIIKRKKYIKAVR